MVGKLCGLIIQIKIIVLIAEITCSFATRKELEITNIYENVHGKHPLKKEVFLINFILFSVLSITEFINSHLIIITK